MLVLGLRLDWIGLCVYSIQTKVGVPFHMGARCITIHFGKLPRTFCLNTFPRSPFCRNMVQRPENGQPISKLVSFLMFRQFPNSQKLLLTKIYSTKQLISHNRNARLKHLSQNVCNLYFVSQLFSWVTKVQMVLCQGEILIMNAS